MAILQESPIYEEGIFQLEKSTPPLGGSPIFSGSTPTQGHANAQAAQLANRTGFLKQQTDSLSTRISSTEVGLSDLQTQVNNNGSATNLKNLLAGPNGAFNVGYQNPGDGGVLETIASKLFRTEVDVEVFGATSSKTIDSSPAFLKAANYVSSRGGGTVRYSGQYLLDTAFTVPDYVSFKGYLESPGELRYNTPYDYDSKSSLIIINPNITISLGSGSSWGNSLVMRKGLDLPFASATAAANGIAAFSGTAFTAAGSDVFIHDLLVLGFNKILYSNNFERTRVHHVQGDNTNGIELNAVYDIAYVDKVHLWPFTTTHQSWTTAALNTRSGTGFIFSNVGDWSKLTECFTYGYAKGFSIDGCNFVNLVGCGTDHYGANPSNTAIGFEIKGLSKDTTMIGCQMAAQGYGLVVDTNVNGLTSTASVVQVVGCSFWDNDFKHADVRSGRVIFSSSNFWRSPVGIDVNASYGKASIDLCDFEDITVNAISSGSFDNLNIGPSNRFTNCVNNFSQRSVLDANPLNIQQYSGVNAGGISLQPRRSRGTTASKAIVQNNDVSWQVDPYLHDGSNFIQSGGIRQLAVNVTGVGNIATRWIISTRAAGATTPSDRWIFDSDGSFKPTGNATQDFGSATNRINNSYFAVAPTVGSDARYKTKPKYITDKVLDAWASVSYKSYQLLEAVEQKGKKQARQHFGVIAQEVVEAFEKQGLDATHYGLLCHDSWEAVPEIPEQLDEQGNITNPKQEAVEAGDRYSIRYEEALVLECALQRRVTKCLEERLTALEKLDATNQ